MPDGPLKTLGRLTHRYGPIRTVLGDGDQLDEDLVERLTDHLSDDHVRLVAVDVGASDKDLKAAFNDWIKGQRRDKKLIRMAMTKDDVKNWAACRVIAYIDILLYVRATKIKPFRPVDIQTALFEDNWTGRAPKKIFEQTTTMYAERLMSERYVSRFAYQFEVRPRGREPVKRRSE